MATLTEQRAALAEALSTVDGVEVSTRANRRGPKAKTGHVVLGAMEPAAFTDVRCELTALVYLGPDAGVAEELLESLGPQLVQAASTLDGAFDVRLEPITVPVGTPPTLVYALTLVAFVEVE